MLVVEDDPDIASLLRKVLTASGYRVSVAGSGSEAREALEQLEPRLVLLDIVLPGADGLVLAATLKSLRSMPIMRSTDPFRLS
jgi:DNA-binding response OmpR family regulator